MPEQVLLELLRGKGAHADPVACVMDLGPQLATKEVDGFPHSIGQLVFHMNYWMNYELRRIRGLRPLYPQHSVESFPSGQTPQDAAEWDHLRDTFVFFLEEFAALAESPAIEMQRQIESGHEGDKQLAGSLRDVLWQMVAHNSYHTGEIAMIRRVLGAWPPQAGGDSW